MKSKVITLGAFGLTFALGIYLGRFEEHRRAFLAEYGANASTRD